MSNLENYHRVQKRMNDLYAESILNDLRTFLYKVYYKDRTPVSSIAVVCTPSRVAIRPCGKMIFWRKNYNPIDRLICTAVEWTLEHCRSDGYRRKEAYIAWFAVRSILLCGFKEVNISDIEKQYWENPRVFRQCFDHCDTCTNCWWRIKNQLEKIKYVIDMWYDKNSSFVCTERNSREYNECKKYFAENKNSLPFDIVNVQSYQHAKNYNKREKYNEEFKSSDIDDHEHIQMSEDDKQWRRWQWENIDKAIGHPNDELYSDSEDSYGGVD